MSQANRPVAHDAACPKCGYVFEPFERECPRCASLARARCQNCGAVGVVARCPECHRQLCAHCAVPVEDAHLCPACAPANLAAAHAVQAGWEEESRLSPGPGFVTGVRLPGDEGFWGGLQRGWVFLVQSLLMAFRAPRLLLPQFLSFLVAAVFLGCVALIFVHFRLQALFAHDTPHVRVLLTLIGLFLGLVLYLIAYFFTGMVIHLINVHLRGRPCQLGPAFRDAVKNSAAIFLLAGATTVVSFVTGLLRSGNKGYDVGDAAANAVDRVWAAAVMLLLPIVVLEDAPLTKAMARAREIHGRSLIPISVGEIGVSVAAGIIDFLSLLLVTGVGLYCYSTFGSAALLPVLIVAGLWFALISAFTSFVRIAYYTCLYLWAVERAVGKRTAPVPTPLAAALNV